MEATSISRCFFQGLLLNLEKKLVGSHFLSFRFRNPKSERAFPGCGAELVPRFKWLRFSWDQPKTFRLMEPTQKLMFLLMVRGS